MVVVVVAAAGTIVPYWLGTVMRRGSALTWRSPSFPAASSFASASATASLAALAAAGSASRAGEVSLVGHGMT